MQTLFSVPPGSLFSKADESAFCLSLVYMPLFTGVYATR